MIATSLNLPVRPRYPRASTLETPAAVVAKRPSVAIRKRATALLARDIFYMPNEKFAAYTPDDAWSADIAAAFNAVAVVKTAKKRVAANMGSPLAQACEMPLLTAKQERALFERMNYLKFLAVQQRGCVDVDAPSVVTLRRVEGALAEAEQIRNRIVGANIRLVISIVKKFADLKNPFDDLMSDGILSMMLAVEKFDFDRGFRFSTYATRAIRRNLYRSLVQRQKDRSRFSNPTTDMQIEVADQRNQSAINERRWDQLQSHLKQMLEQLEPRERAIVLGRFSAEKSDKVQTLQALAKTLGVCKERVRQLEKRAIDKLQKMVRDIKIDEPTA